MATMKTATKRTRRPRAGRGRRGARPRWQRRKAARPEELVAAALEVFVDRGFAAATLDDVARHAGVTKGTIYLYFDNKEALFRAMVRQMIVPAIAAAEQTVDQHTGSTTALFRDLMTAWWRQVGESGLSGITKLVCAEARNFPEVAKFYHAEVAARGRRLFERVLERGVAQGEFRPLDVRYATRVAMAPVLYAAIYKHSFLPCETQPIDLEKLVQTHVHTFLRGIATHPDATHA